MSLKDKTIADIVKDLNKLTLKQNTEILKFIKETKQHNQSSLQPVKHRDRDGNPLQVGDKVFLLTKGVNNTRGERATIHSLPEKEGNYIEFIPKSLENDEFIHCIKKLGKSVRKIRKKN